MNRRAHNSELPLALTITKKRFSFSIFLLLGLLILFLVWSYPGINRQGYSPDEELTFFSVEGISQTGFPFMPSGAMYYRGSPYSYLCWIAGNIFGYEFRTYRLVSLFSVCFAVLVLFVLAMNFTLPATSILVIVLMACSVWTIMVAQWARFYGMFFLFYMLSILVYFQANRNRSVAWLFFFMLFISRLLHEFAVTLIALPLFYYLSSSKEENRLKEKKNLLASIIIIAIVQIAYFILYTGFPKQLLMPGLYNAWLHFGETVVAPEILVVTISTSLFSYAAIALYALLLIFYLGRMGINKILIFLFVLLAAIFQNGIILFIIAVSVIIHPQSVSKIIKAAIITLLSSSIFWTLHTVTITNAVLSKNIISSLISQSLVYPLDAFKYSFETWPLTTILTCLSLIYLLKSSSTIKALSFLLLCELGFLGIVNASYRPRYFLIIFPICYILIFTTIEFVNQQRISPSKKGVMSILTLLIIIIITFENWKSTDNSILIKRGGNIKYLALFDWRTAPIEKWKKFTKNISNSETVICNDTLACMLLGLTPNYWWFENTRSLKHFSLQNSNGRYEMYTRSEILRSIKDVERKIDESTKKEISVICVDTGKYGFKSFINDSKKGGKKPELKYKYIKRPGIEIVSFNKTIKNEK